MRRRDFIILLSAAAGFHHRALAQNSPLLIGYLSSKDESAEAAVIKGMSVGLADQGIIL